MHSLRSLYLTVIILFSDDPNYRYTKEQKSVCEYIWWFSFKHFHVFCTDNLEHFDTNDQNKSTPYEDELIDKKQFSAMLISFSGLKKNDMIVSALIDFFRTSYKESEEDSTSKKTLVSPLNNGYHS